MAVLLPQQSRYANIGFITEFSSSESVLEQSDYTEPSELSYQYHELRAGEEITQIAYKYYGGQVPNASEYYYVICLSNGIFTPYDLTDFVGKYLRIPNILQWLNRVSE